MIIRVVHACLAQPFYLIATLISHVIVVTSCGYIVYASKRKFRIFGKEHLSSSIELANGRRGDGSRLFFEVGQYVECTDRLSHLTTIGQFERKRVEDDGINTLHLVVFKDDSGSFTCLKLFFGNERQFAIEHTKHRISPINTSKFCTYNCQQTLHALGITQIVGGKMVVFQRHLLAFPKRSVIDGWRHDIEGLDLRTVANTIREYQVSGGTFYVGSRKIYFYGFSFGHIWTKRYGKAERLSIIIIRCTKFGVGNHVHSYQHLYSKRREGRLRLFDFYAESQRILTILHLRSKHLCSQFGLPFRINLAIAVRLAGCT